MVDQADVDARTRDGSLDKLYLGSLTTTAQEPKYFSHKENVMQESPAMQQPQAPAAEAAAAAGAAPATRVTLGNLPSSTNKVAPSLSALPPRVKAAELLRLRDSATAAANDEPYDFGLDDQDDHPEAGEAPRPPSFGLETMPIVMEPAGKSRVKGRVKKTADQAIAKKLIAKKTPAAKRPLPAAKSFGVITSLTASIGLRTAPEPSGQEANIIYLDVENDYALCVDKGARVEIIEETTLFQAGDATLVDEHWLKVSVFNFKTGWLKAKYVTKEPPAAAKKPAAAAKKKTEVLSDGESSDEESSEKSSDESSDEDAYDVECIVDERTKGKKTEFLVKWEGWPADDNTWEPLQHVQHLEAFAAWRARTA